MKALSLPPSRAASAIDASQAEPYPTRRPKQCLKPIFHILIQYITTVAGPGGWGAKRKCEVSFFGAYLIETVCASTELPPHPRLPPGPTLTPQARAANRAIAAPPRARGPRTEHGGLHRSFRRGATRFHRPVRHRRSGVVQGHRRRRRELQFPPAHHET